MVEPGSEPRLSNSNAPILTLEYTIYFIGVVRALKEAIHMKELYKVYDLKLVKDKKKMVTNSQSISILRTNILTVTC